MDERVYWLGFSVFPGVGPYKFASLLSEFVSAEKAWHAQSLELVKILGPKLTKDFRDFRNKFDFDNYLKKLDRAEVDFLILKDVEYPKLLKEIPNPPFVLYIKAKQRFDLNSFVNPIAVVGTRKISSYGQQVTQQLTSDLVGAGMAIVSGLAYGVDAAAHQTAIHSGGKTIAVLGCGVDCCYPSSNQTLYNSILEKDGLIISEVPLGYPPTVGTFPSRNRIVAGLSQAVLVTEGAEDSGALITADFAAQFGRKVFAVPGPITSKLSKGPYKLISKGAKLVTSGEDILNELGIINHELGKKIAGDTPEEQMIIDLLQNEAMDFDEIARRLKMDSAKIGSILSLMEMKGLIHTNISGVIVLAV